MNKNINDYCVEKIPSSVLNINGVSLPSFIINATVFNLLSSSVVELNCLGFVDDDDVDKGVFVDDDDDAPDAPDADDDVDDDVDKGVFVDDDDCLFKNKLYISSISLILSEFFISILSTINLS
jgi:hypothetical protein